MNKLWIWIVSFVAFFGIIYLAYTFTNKPSDKLFPELTKTNQSDYTKWSPEKKNLLVEYSDFQCPACKSFAEYMMEEIEASGSANSSIMKKVTFVYRHFPLTQHAQAEPAAFAAEAAGKQGKFYEYADVLFAKQKEWVENKDASKKFEEYAKKLGLDLNKFNSDRESKEVRNKVSADLQSGLKFEVNATPTFYLNGKKLGPINSFEDFIKPLRDL